MSMNPVTNKPITSPLAQNVVEKQQLPKWARFATLVIAGLAAGTTAIVIANNFKTVPQVDSRVLTDNTARLTTCKSQLEALMSSKTNQCEAITNLFYTAYGLNDDGLGQGLLYLTKAKSCMRPNPRSAMDEVPTVAFGPYTGDTDPMSNNNRLTTIIKELTVCEEQLPSLMSDQQERCTEIMGLFNEAYNYTGTDEAAQNPLIAQLKKTDCLKSDNEPTSLSDRMCWLKSSDSLVLDYLRQNNFSAPSLLQKEVNDSEGIRARRLMENLFCRFDMSDRHPKAHCDVDSGATTCYVTADHKQRDFEDFIKQPDGCNREKLNDVCMLFTKNMPGAITETYLIDGDQFWSRGFHLAPNCTHTLDPLNPKVMRWPYKS